MPDAPDRPPPGFRTIGLQTFFRQPLEETLTGLEQVISARSPFRAMAPVLLALVITWFIYVPIHELLHCAGCVVTGGEVSRLEVSPRYGGQLLAKVFPFVVSGSDYAGQLTGFDTKGNDLIYLATDFGPFVLTVLIGVPLIRLCARRRRPILFGVAIVVGLAPLYNIPGDYYEMGSIITTRAATLITGGSLIGSAAFEGVRSDDVFKLFTELIKQPDKLGLAGGGQIAVGAMLIAISLAVDVFLVFLTFFLGGLVATPLVGKATRRKSPRPS